MRHGLPDEHVDRDVVEHVAVVVDDAVLAVRRVRVERDIGDNHKVGIGRLDCAHHRLNESVGIGAFGAIEAFLFLVDHREQRNGGDAELADLAQLFEQAVSGLAFDAGHRRHCLTAVVTLEHEYGINQIRRAQAGFCDEAPQCGAAPVAAQANSRELNVSWDTHNRPI